MKQRSEQQHRAVAATSEWGSASAKLDDRRILSNSTIWFQKYKIAYFSPDKLLRAHIQIQLYLGFSAKLFRFVRQCQRVRCFVVLKLIKKKQKALKFQFYFMAHLCFDSGAVVSHSCVWGVCRQYLDSSYLHCRNNGEPNLSHRSWSSDCSAPLFCLAFFPFSFASK